MILRRLALTTAIVIGLHEPSLAAIYTINNPADKITNPADKIFNPATQINNPAINIYNPAGRMDNPNPLSPPTQPAPQSATETTTQTTTPKPVGQICEQPQPKPKPFIPEKRYNFKTARAYVTAAKKAFYLDKYIEFLSITEDALRRISNGTLKASKKTKAKLNKYNAFGYGLLEQNEE